MAFPKSLFVVVTLLVLSVNRLESKSLKREAPAKRAIDPISAISAAVKVAMTIHGAVCSLTEICGGDELPQELEKLEKKLDAIHSDVISIKKDVEDIWDESKRKWYFKHIEYIVDQRKNVIHDLQNNDNSGRAKLTRQRFINEVFGEVGKDEYVEKALFHIPVLITKEGLVTHHFDVQIRNGKSTVAAAKLNWVFIRKLFRYQEDGYASVVLAASIKYKNDEASYKKTMSEVCSWWPKLTDPEYEEFCTKFGKNPAFQNRRKLQQDFIFSIRDLALVPVQLKQTDCSKFKDSDTLLFSAGYLYVAQPDAKKILIVNPETLDIVKTIHVPGSECGGNCHPFGIAINVEHKVMALAAQSKMSGGESKVLMFKIKGKLEEPSGITIEHYYSKFQLMQPGPNRPDVRGVSFCGERFAYADYNGAIWNYGMRWGDFNPVPNLWDRYDWSLERVYGTYKGYTYYLGCSNSGRDWLVEKTYYGGNSDGVGAVPSDSRERYTENILDIAEIAVKKSDWKDVMDGRSRMNKLKGIAMDTKRNLFYSSEQYYGNSVSGVYQRTYDGKRHYIREWNEDSKVKMFGMAVDDSGFLFSVQKDRSNSKCLHKFRHEIDLEDITVP